MADDEFEICIGEEGLIIDPEDEYYEADSKSFGASHSGSQNPDREAELLAADINHADNGYVQEDDTPKRTAHVALEPGNVEGEGYDQQMDDDEYDHLMSQIDENEVRQAYPGGSGVAGGQAPAPETPTRIQNSNPSSSNVFKKPTPLPPAKGPTRSPLKRELKMSSEMSGFFSSQEDPHQIVPPKRRFPGPAGLLPNISINDIKTRDEAKLSACQRILSGTSKRVMGIGEAQRVQSPCRVNVNILKHKESESESLVSNAPWRSMIRTLNLNLKDEDSLLNIMNIAWVKGKAKKFPSTARIPLLVLVVKEELEAISSKSKTRNCVRLMDYSGVITAALDSTFINAYGDKVVPGTSLALRNCRILNHRKSVILTVSKKNVLCLTTTKEFADDQLTPTGSNELPSYNADENGVFVLQRAPWVPEKIVQEYDDMMESMKMIKSNIHDESENVHHVNRMNQNQSRPSLFSTVALNNSNKQRNAGEPPQRPQATASNLTTGFFCSENAQANFATDASGFQDDDDEFLQALEGMDDFVIDEDSQ